MMLVSEDRRVFFLLPIYKMLKIDLSQRQINTISTIFIMKSFSSDFLIKK